ncbi:hypothetical protein OG216_46435 (plasmid) [Streptomycetaceae bacterium NBC_01309]
MTETVVFVHRDSVGWHVHDGDGALRISGRRLGRTRDEWCRQALVQGLLKDGERPAWRLLDDRLAAVHDHLERERAARLRAQARERELELQLIGALRDLGASWPEVGILMQRSGQWAHQLAS